MKHSFLFSPSPRFLCVLSVSVPLSHPHSLILSLRLAFAALLPSPLVLQNISLCMWIVAFLALPMIMMNICMENRIGGVGSSAQEIADKYEEGDDSERGSGGGGRRAGGEFTGVMGGGGGGRRGKSRQTNQRVLTIRKV